MISTLMVFATKYLQLSAQSLGWLLSGYGVSTMISEGVLVRVIVPQFGEINSIRFGLICFSIQCFVIAFSSSVDGIILSILFSMGSNLVYPSISSIVSKAVGEDKQGEALGALNGIKALVRTALHFIFRELFLRCFFFQNCVHIRLRVLDLLLLDF